MGAVKLSILDPVTISPGLNSGQAMHQSIELACLAEQLGYSRYWIVEHHAVHYEATPAPEVLTAMILQHTQKIKVGMGGILLNYHNPYKMAEVVKSLHVLFPHRFEIGIGRGSSGEIADYALNSSRIHHSSRIHQQNPQDYVTVLAEFLHWLGNDFPENHQFSQIPIMRDVQSVPPVWILAATLHSARQAATMGLNLAWGAFINPADSINGLCEYRQHFTTSKWAVSQQQAQDILAVRVIVADTQQQAERLAMPVRLLFKIRREQKIMPQHMLTAEQAITQAGEIFPAEQQIWPMYVVGDQQQVYTKLNTMLEQSQASEIMIQDVLPNSEYRKYTYHTLAKLFHLQG